MIRERVKRASYRNAIDFIAQNDSVADDDADDPDVVGYLVSSVLVSEIFGVSPEKVGRDVVRRRMALWKAGEL